MQIVTNVINVIENGNRLCYVSMAKQMLSFIESSRKGNVMTL